jgi:hypothetical protein
MELVHENLVLSRKFTDRLTFRKGEECRIVNIQRSIIQLSSISIQCYSILCGSDFLSTD